MADRVQDLVNIIINAFKARKLTVSSNIGKSVHIMEISQAILNVNYPGMSFTKFKNALFSNTVLTSTNKTTGITKEIPVKLFPLNVDSIPRNTDGSFIINKIYYKETRDKLLIISPNYLQMQRVLSKITNALNLTGTDVFNVGHTAGYGKEEKNTVTGARIIDALNTVSSEINVQKVFDYYDTRLTEIHSNYKVNVDRRIFGELEGKLSFIYTVPQQASINQHIIGPQERTLAGNFAKGDTKLYSFIANNLLEAKQSPSMLDMLFNKLKNTFLGIRVSAEHYFFSKSGVIKNKVSGKAVQHKIKSSTFIKNDKLDLLKIRNLINLKLHDEIKRHMGDGRTKEILNYRTGRFARSAEVENISQTREGYLQMTYSYMRYPYDVFLYPSGYLSKPGRDPRGIIGPSIRQLASKYISNNFKVNPVLRGDR